MLPLYIYIQYIYSLHIAVIRKNGAYNFQDDGFNKIIINNIIIRPCSYSYSYHMHYKKQIIIPEFAGRTVFVWIVSVAVCDQ